MDWNVIILGDVRIGESVIIRNLVILDAMRVGKGIEFIKIGNNTNVEYGLQIYSWGGFVNIRDGCSVNAYCVIFGTGGISIGNPSDRCRR